MSDTYYRERAARRTRRWLILAGIAAAIVVIALVTRTLLYDACTRSFDRSPRSIVSTFVEAVGRGDAAVAQECWEHDAYYELDAGCSEICLSRILGTQYEVLDIALDSPHITPEGRANLRATVSIQCADSGEEHSGEVLLDSVGSNVPWKHWAIIRSTFGGSVPDPWCE
jgi:hypothetical protein